MSNYEEQLTALKKYDARNKEDTFIMTWIDLGDKFAVHIEDSCPHPNCTCRLSVKLADIEYEVGKTEEYDEWIRPFAQLFLIPSLENAMGSKKVRAGMSIELKANPTQKFGWRFVFESMDRKKKILKAVLQSKLNPSYVPKRTEPVAAPEHDPC
jgi:hypothetical protein